MRLRSRIMMRILFAALLLLAAAGITLIIKDAMNERDPENALPTIAVNYQGAPIPAECTMMDSYSWRFLTSTHNWRADTDAASQLNGAYVTPGMPLSISFSFASDSLKVSRSKEGEPAYNEIEAERLETPREPGTYTYRVEAEWNLRGSVLYYFKLTVPDNI